MLSDSQMIERAIAIALKAHSGQEDKYGAPYILHPLRVGLGGTSAVEITAGILHDVVEDSAVTIEHLRKREEFPPAVITIVDALTKREGEEWEAYIDRVIACPQAMPVKLRDLEQNLDARRIGEFSEADAKRFTRYVWAWHRIRKAMGNW